MPFQGLSTVCISRSGRSMKSRSTPTLLRLARVAAADAKEVTHMSRVIITGRVFPMAGKFLEARAGNNVALPKPSDLLVEFHLTSLAHLTNF